MKAPGPADDGEPGVATLHLLPRPDPSGVLPPASVAGVATTAARQPKYCLALPLIAVKVTVPHVPGLPWKSWHASPPFFCAQSPGGGNASACTGCEAKRATRRTPATSATRIVAVYRLAVPTRICPHALSTHHGPRGGCIRRRRLQQAPVRSSVSSSRQVHVGDVTYYFCCAACLTYFRAHEADVLRKRGLA